MNKLISPLVVLVAVAPALMLQGCSKELATPTAAQQVMTAEHRLAGGPQIVDTWYDDGGTEEGVNFGCKGEPTDCYETIVVTGGSAPALSAVFTAISSGVQSSIRKAFMQHRTILLDHMIETHIDQVILGTAQATMRSGNGKRYVIIDDHTQAGPTGVYPFI